VNLGALSPYNIIRPHHPAMHCYDVDVIEVGRSKVPKLNGMIFIPIFTKMKLLSVILITVFEPGDRRTSGARACGFEQRILETKKII
jgi:hypothetical protein